MAINNKNWQKKERAKTIKCSCGGISKLVSLRNYPFGKKSKAVKSVFYRCKDCGERTFISDEKGGRR